MNIYVDYMTGLDTTGDGSTASPYKTLHKALNASLDGDSIFIAEYAGIFEEEDVILVEGKQNLSIKVINKNSTLFRVNNMDSYRTAIHIRNCSFVTLEGFSFTSIVYNPADPNQIIQKHAVLMENCSECRLINNTISTTWECPVEEDTLFFKLHNCDNCVVSSVTAENLHNSGNMETSLVTITGNGYVDISSVFFKNISSNNGYINAISLKDFTAKVRIDGVYSQNITSQVYDDVYIDNINANLVDKAAAISIVGTSSSLDVKVNGLLSIGAQAGVRCTNVSADSNVIFMRMGIVNSRIGVYAKASKIKVYNTSIHSTKTRKFEVHGQLPKELPTFGIYACDESIVYTLNNTYTGVATALSVYTDSQIYVEHTIWYNCDIFKSVNGTRSAIYVKEYVRAAKPLFADADNGNFNVSDDSPCIDSGKFYGESFLGLAPDIGMRERAAVLSVDSLSLMASRAARMSSLVPLTELDLEGAILKGIKDTDPTVQAEREGSSVRDIMVKPLLTIMYPFVTQLEYIRSQLSFKNIETLSLDNADALAANFFIYRDYGGKASGVIRLFMKDATSITIPAELRFTNGSLNYYTTSEVTFSGEEVALNYDNGLYYVDALIEAENEGAEYNVEANQITTAGALTPTNVVTVTNPFPVTGGRAIETNAELKEKVKTGIAVRDLVTTKGIKTVLDQEFVWIKEVTPIGFRDPEMTRDTLNGKHIGGKIDIYVKPTNITEDYFDVEAAEPIIHISNSTIGKCPIYKITGIEVTEFGDTTEEWLTPKDYTILPSDPDTRFSIYEKFDVQISDDFVGSDLRVHLKYCPEISVLQSWLLNSDNRVVCASLWAKIYRPCFVSMSIVVTLPYIDSVKETFAKEIKTKIESYIYGLTGGQQVKSSDIVDICYSYGASKVDLPIYLNGEEHTIDNEIVQLSSPDTLEVSRITRFIPDEIYITAI